MLMDFYRNFLELFERIRNRRQILCVFYLFWLFIEKPKPTRTKYFFLNLSQNKLYFAFPGPTNQVVKIYSASSTFVKKIFFMCEDLAGEENALGRFLKEEGKSDKTR